MLCLNKNRLFSLGLLLTALYPSFAQEYEAFWWTIDGGGGMMFCTGGEFDLCGTIGQHDAGVLTGGEFELIGGFWFDCCQADLDGDCDTDHSDLGILLSSWGIDDGGDLNCDGETDHADLGILLADYGCGAGP